MKPPLKLGYKASSEQFAPNQLLEYGLLAETLGLDSVWISDHFQPWRHSGGHAPFSLAWLGALGARSSRVIMGTSMLTPTFRYHPSIVAQAFGTLGAMFPGRVALGIGTGESLNEVPSSGITWPEQSERTARFKEAVDLIRRLWSEERLSYHGNFYKTENATIYDRPEQPVPLYIAAAGRSWPGSPARRATASSVPAARNGSCTPRPCCRTWKPACRRPARRRMRSTA